MDDRAYDRETQIVVGVVVAALVGVLLFAAAGPGASDALARWKRDRQARAAVEEREQQEKARRERELPRQIDQLRGELQEMSLQLQRERATRR